MSQAPRRRRPVNSIDRRRPMNGPPRRAAEMSLANRAASVYGGLATRTRRLRPAAPRQRLVVNDSSGVSLRLTPTFGHSR